MFTKIKNKTTIEIHPDDLIIDGYKVLSYRREISDEDLTKTIFKYLDEMRIYHEKQTFDKVHIKNMFNKKYGWYINKDIMKLLQDNKYVTAKE